MGWATHTETFIQACITTYVDISIYKHTHTHIYIYILYIDLHCIHISYEHTHIYIYKEAYACLRVLIDA